MVLKIINDFITENETDEILKIIDDSKWTYNNASAEGSEGVVFWHMTLKNKIFEDKILRKIENLMGKKFEVLRVKVNGQTYGLEGSWHHDYVDDGIYTLLIYVSEIFPCNIKEIGGYTYFHGINNQIIGVEPYQKRAVIFDSKMKHKGMAPRTKNMLRMSVAFNLKEIK